MRFKGEVETGQWQFQLLFHAGCDPANGTLFGPQDFALSFADAIVNS
jgi:hypothetical protein